MNKEEVEMIYRDNDIHYLEQENKQLKEQLGKLSKLDEIDFWLEYNKEVLNLQKENIELEKRIDKAIEYMNKIKYDKTDEYISISQYKEYKIFLEILRGDKN